MARRVWLTGAAILAAAALAGLWLWLRGAPAYRGATADASLLLVTVDGLRCDRTGACAGQAGLTPSIDRLASHGVAFERAITAAAGSGPSHASLLTGQWPFAHGLRWSGDRLAPPVSTLAGMLAARGVKTWAIVSSPEVSGLSGLDRGFEIYDDHFASRHRSAAAVTDAAIERLKHLPSGRFFLWVHYSDPSLPIAAPEPFRARRAGRPYDGIVSMLDAEVGRLIDALEGSPRRARTLVVLAGTHGQALDAHGEMLSGSTVHDEVVRVPLIVSMPPHVPAGVRVPAVVRTVDVLPTVADLLRMEGAAAALPGVTLWPWMAGRPPEGGLTAYVEAMEGRDHGWSPVSGLRDERYLFVDSPRPRLYEPAIDPAETNDLAGSRPDVVSEYRARLQALRSGAPGGGHAVDGRAAPAMEDAPDHVRAVHRTRMALAGGQPEAAVREARSALEHHSGDVGLGWMLGEALAASGDAAAAADPLRAVLNARPDHRAARAALADVLLRLGAVPEAERVAAEGRDRDPDDPRWSHLMARGALARRDGNEAGRLLVAALRIRPDHLPSIRLMASLLESAGKLDEAASFRARAVEVAPHELEDLMSWSWILFRQDKHEEALDLLERARERAPGSAGVLTAVADVRRAMGRFSEAREAYAKALEADPQAAQALYGLGIIDLKEGNAQRAAEALARAVQMRPAAPAWREDYARALAAAGRYEAAADQMDLYLSSGRAPASRREELAREAASWRRQGRP